MTVLSIRPQPYLVISSLLLIVPLAKAGMTDWMPLVLTIAISLTLYWHSITKKNETNIKRLRSWQLVYVAYTGLIFLQLFIFPRLVDWNSPALEASMLDLIHRPINSLAILSSWILFSAYWGFTWLVASLSRQNVIKCFLVIAAAVFFQAGYGAAGVIFGQETIIGIWPKEYYQNTATGTFVNHNHFANFLAIAFPLAAAGIHTYAQKSKINGKILCYVGLLLLSFLTIYALIASLSRMGIAIGCIGMLVIGFVILNHRFNLSFIAKTALLVGLILVGLNITNLIGIEALINRFERVLIYDMRWDIWATMFELPKSMYVFGSGASTFFDVFLQVHPPTLPKTAYYAHNEYLQFTLEYGVIGLGVLGFSFYRWYKINANAGRCILYRSAQLGIILMAIHSLVDFPLRIPANALLFWFCVGVLVNSNIGSSRNSAKSNVSDRMSPVKVRRRRSLARSKTYQFQNKADLKVGREN